MEVDQNWTQSEVRELRRALDELRLLNELAVDTAQARDVEEILGMLVRRLLGALKAKQGVVTLLEERGDSTPVTLVRTTVGSGGNVSLRPDEALLAWMSLNRRPLRVSNPQAHPIFGNFDWDDTVESVLCVPLLARGRLLGVLSLYNKRDQAEFSEPDARLLTIIATQSAQIIDSRQAREERDRIRNVFGRHTAPAVVEELLRHDVDPPGRRQEVCIMFFDLRGFTSFSESAEPEDVVDYLNAIFAIAITAVVERTGIVHQLLGDGLMAVFGAPILRGDDCENAVAASLAIVERVEAECQAGRLRATRVGIGLHTGEVVAGTVGSDHHKEYKVTGDVVNVAARIEQMNKEYDSRVLVSEAVWDRVAPGRYPADDLGECLIRGRSQSLRLFRLA